MKRMLLSAVFIAIGSAAFAQQTDVSGTVKDEAGEAIIGASVTEEGTKNATVTDFDGNFRLKTAQGAKLKISYIGYKTATVNAGQSLVVTLHEDNNVMDELVVTGYTTQRRAGRCRASWPASPSWTTRLLAAARQPSACAV